MNEPVFSPCPICGNTSFPNRCADGRTNDGLPLRCALCGSKEWHRAIYGVWETLRILYPLNTYVCLQFSKDPSIRSEWFKEFHASQYGGENSMDLQQIPLPDACVDAVVCNHVLEHVADDVAALREMLRIVRLNGFIQISFPFYRAEKTNDWGYPDERQYGHYRLYGGDILDLFVRALPGAFCVTMLGHDVCTKGNRVIFLISHRPVLRPAVSAFPHAHFQRLEEGASFPPEIMKFKLGNCVSFQQPL
jgi:SAM-dependent methyltransferase